MLLDILRLTVAFGGVALIVAFLVLAHGFHRDVLNDRSREIDLCLCDMGWSYPCASEQ